MLTEEQVDSYFENGQVTAPFKLSEEVIGAIQTKMEALFKSRPDLTPDYLPALIEMDQSWLEFAMLPEILDIVEQLIGPDIIVWSSALFCKSPGQGKATPWHQDAQYWPIRPLETTTVWIAVDPSTQENGCLRVVPGSHLTGRIVEHSRNPGRHGSWTQVDESRAVDLVIPAGTVVLFSANLLHGAYDNHSNRTRYSTAWHYMPEELNPDRFPKGVYEDRHVARTH